MNKNLELGQKGEALVAKYLESKGFTIEEQNYLIKGGEIDIIAKKGNTLVFVESKLRTNPLFHISQVVNTAKQKKIIRTALFYISKNRLSNLIFRFDVALIEKANNTYNINYIQNAFTQSEDNIYGSY